MMKVKSDDIILNVILFAGTIAHQKLNRLLADARRRVRTATTAAFDCCCFFGVAAAVTGGGRDGGSAFQR